MKKLLKIIKIIAITAVVIFALGIVGNNDHDEYIEANACYNTNICK